jgi:hypothetical protein
MSPFSVNESYTSQMTTERKANCRGCSGDSLQVVWKMPDCVYGDLFTKDLAVALQHKKHDLTLAICPDCELLQLLNETNIQTQYDDYLYQTKITFGLSEFYEDLSEKLSILFYEEKKSALDIGSNDGSFLKSLSEKGFDVLGIEPAKYPAAVANANGIETLREYFDSTLAKQIARERGNFDLVTINYALANVPNLTDVLLGAQMLLKEDGILNIVTGYHPDQFSINMFDYVGHDHLTYLTVSNLDRLGTRTGMKLIDVARVEHKGGSLVATFSKTISGRKKSNSVHQLLQREMWQNCNSAEFILNLKLRIEAQKNNLKNFITKHSIDTMTGIGASISTTYLSNYMEIDHLIENLFDDDRRKWQSFAPGSGVQVLPLESIQTARNEFSILLAWQHSNRISSRLKDLKFEGRLIIPLPFLREIYF